MYYLISPYQQYLPAIVGHTWLYKAHTIFLQITEHCLMLLLFFVTAVSLNQTPYLHQPLIRTVKQQGKIA